MTQPLSLAELIEEIEERDVAELDCIFETSCFERTPPFEWCYFCLLRQCLVFLRAQRDAELQVITPSRQEQP